MFFLSRSSNYRYCRELIRKCSYLKYHTHVHTHLQKIVKNIIYK